MPQHSKLDKVIIGYIKAHPSASIAEVTYAISGYNHYTEIRGLIDDGTLEVHGEPGRHTLIYKGGNN